MVMVYASGGHHVDTEISTVLYRTDAGKWIGDVVSQTRGWAPDAANETRAEKIELAAEAGKRLDEILESECLYAEPGQVTAVRHGPPSLGALQVQLDIKNHHRQHTAVFLSGWAEGLTAEVARIVMTR